MLKLDHQDSAGAEFRRCITTAGIMHAISSNAEGTVASPSRRLCDVAEIHPVIHGSTEPPNPQTASIHREFAESSASAKNRASSSGKTGASAAPSRIMAASRAGVAEKPTSSEAAVSAAITAPHNIVTGLARNNTSEETAREARNPHQYSDDEAAAAADPVLELRNA